MTAKQIIVGVWLAALTLTLSAAEVSARKPRFVADAEAGFNLIVVGDPQPQTEEQITRLEREILPAIGAIVEEYQATQYPTAILLTGDVVWDTMEYLPRVKTMFESLGVPVYAVIGNHDHAADIVDDEPLAESHCIAVFGARTYSLMLGNSRLIALDNIAYTSHDDYRIAVSRKQLRWLRREVRKTPREQRMVVMMHAPAVNYHTGETLDYAKRIMRIVGERELHFVTGHRHRHATVDIAPDVVEHSIAQVSGNLWFAPICSDGTPRGVFCIEERDNSLRWHHRLLRESRDKQIIVYSENSVIGHEEYVVAKIVGWDAAWSITWSEDGVERGEMEQIEIIDPDYMYYVEHMADYDDVIMSRLRRSAYPHRHYFRCCPSAANSTIIITATDRFGRSFSEKLTRE